MICYWKQADLPIPGRPETEDAQAEEMTLRKPNGAEVHKHLDPFGPPTHPLKILFSVPSPIHCSVPARSGLPRL